ncbi:33426_t:CDS:2, partial [Racocetra persica]
MKVLGKPDVYVSCCPFRVERLGRRTDSHVNPGVLGSSSLCVQSRNPALRVELWPGLDGSRATIEAR